MPLHDVKCSRCGHIFEEFWLPTERPISISCHKCESLRTKVLPGAPKIGFGGNETERNLENQASKMGW
tara:strand:+ start:589 stop:792 length:204 start_codon:yes stop_codon:yes gene_type:complete